jgi:hypothetical protein
MDDYEVVAEELSQSERDNDAAIARRRANE